MNLKKFIDENLQISTCSNISLLEQYPKTAPIILLNKILMDIKSTSLKISNLTDQINIVKLLNDKLQNLSKSLNLPSNHFDININGKPYIIKNHVGQHYILPTHFEKGAYLSLPHFDHDIQKKANQLPKIHIGKFTRFGKNSSINAGGNIDIGNYVWLAPESVLLRQEHSAYGQPAVAARSLSMTRQPSIKINDYAWIGRGAIVGWNCQYIGRQSIVGSKSFINRWVGDYSIVGDHSKILNYLPYKAYLDIYYQPHFIQLLKISNWNKVNNAWIKEFNSQYNLHLNKSYLIKLLNDLSNTKDNVLIYKTPAQNIISGLKGQRTDILLSNKKEIPYDLEIAKEEHYMNLRIRYIDDKLLSIPADSAKWSFDKYTGYQVVIALTNKFSLQEIKRVTNNYGYILLPSNLNINDKELNHILTLNLNPEVSLYQKKEII